MGVGTIGQNARDVFEQPAAGDVGQRIDLAGADQRQQARHVNAGRGDQRVDQQLILIEQGRAIELPALVRRESAHQRIAVGMDTGRGEAEQHVTGRDLVTRELFSAFDRADAEAREVIIAGRIHPRHLRRLAADQRAARDLAAFRNPRDHALGDPVLQLAGGEIVKEEQRLGALHDQIVDAHCDQINADSIVPVMLDRELELGAYTIIGGDQQRIIISGRLGIEEPPKAPQFTGRAGARGRLCQRGDGFDQRIARGNRNAGIGVGVASALRRAIVVCPRSHAQSHSLSRLEFQPPLGKGRGVSP